MCHVMWSAKPLAWTILNSQSVTQNYDTPLFILVSYSNKINMKIDESELHEKDMGDASLTMWGISSQVVFIFSSENGSQKSKSKLNWAETEWYSHAWQWLMTMKKMQAWWTCFIQHQKLKVELKKHCRRARERQPQWQLYLPKLRRSGNLVDNIVMDWKEIYRWWNLKNDLQMLDDFSTFLYTPPSTSRTADWQDSLALCNKIGMRLIYSLSCFFDHYKMLLSVMPTD